MLDKYLLSCVQSLYGGDEMARRYSRDRTERIDIRCSPMEKLTLETAARQRGQTLSAFLLGCAVASAAAVSVIVEEGLKERQEGRKRP